MRMMAIVAVFLFACAGCVEPSKPLFTPTQFPVVQASSDLAAAQDDVAKAHQQVQAAAENIGQTIVYVRGTMEASDSPAAGGALAACDMVSEQLVVLHSAKALLAKAIAKMASAGVAIAKAEEYLEMSIKERDQAVKERDAAVAAKQKAEERNAKATHAMLRWLMLGCFIVIGAGAAMAFVAKNVTLGIGMGVSGGTVLALAVAVDRFLEYIAIAGAILLALAVVGLVVLVYRRQKALQETVRTAEVAKAKLSPEDRAAVFGAAEHDTTPIADKIQSGGTQALVSKIRTSLGLASTE